MIANKSFNKNIHGFTLIEILVVIGLISVLAAITVIAIRPAENFADARNTERRAEVTQILSALSQYYIDGNSYDNIVDNDDSDPLPTCGGTDGNISLSDDDIDNNYSLSLTNDSVSIIVPGFLAAVPADPEITSGADSGYDICITGSGDDARITISAPLAEGESIIVSR